MNDHIHQTCWNTHIQTASKHTNSQFTFCGYRQELSKLPEPAVPRAWSAGLYKAFGALVTISGGKNHGTMEKTYGKLYGFHQVSQASKYGKLI
jgi:hypothetical protein